MLVMIIYHDNYMIIFNGIFGYDNFMIGFKKCNHMINYLLLSKEPGMYICS